jgi:biopolymer transport protein ExbD
MRGSRSSCPRPGPRPLRPSRRLPYDGRAFLGEQEVPLDQLFKKLKDMIGGQKDRLVVIKAVKVMDLAKAAGADRLWLATEKDF